jgi:hypothetical protein
MRYAILCEHGHPKASEDLADTVSDFRIDMVGVASKYNHLPARLFTFVNGSFAGQLYLAMEELIFVVCASESSFYLSPANTLQK